MTKKPAYQIADLLYLMSRLRDPETGCPWDLEQDFQTIVPYTLEEAYEVADAIERQDWQHLEDELGDLLFQVVFYSRLGQEKNWFDFNSIVNRLIDKLVRRHPHVFPDGELTAHASTRPLSASEVNARWEEIKQQERVVKAGHNENQTLLADIPKGMPALSRAEKIQKRAAQVGFDWHEPLAVLDKLEEEIAELRSALQAQDVVGAQEEVGDLLFAQVNLARHLKIKSESALRATNHKFERRFSYVEQQVNASGRTWGEHSLDELDSYWDRAKEAGL